MEINLNITLNGNFSNLTLPVEEDMLLIDFIIAIEQLMKTMVDNIKTYDLYDTSFQRIALVSEEELYIAEQYKKTYFIKDLMIDTVEVIGLGQTTVSKVLQEERDLLIALENYKI